MSGNEGNRTTLSLTLFYEHRICQQKQDTVNVADLFLSGFPAFILPGHIFYGKQILALLWIRSPAALRLAMSVTEV